MTEQHHVLMTGASGVVGSALLPRLHRHRVVALTHATPVGGRQVRGDLTRAGSGWTPATYRRLLDRVDVVVHAAAVTDFAAGEAGHGRAQRRGHPAGARLRRPGRRPRALRVDRLRRPGGADHRGPGAGHLGGGDQPRPPTSRRSGGPRRWSPAAGCPPRSPGRRSSSATRSPGRIARFQGLHAVRGTAAQPGAAPAAAAGRAGRRRPGRRRRRGAGRGWSTRGARGRVLAHRRAAPRRPPGEIVDSCAISAASSGRSRPAPVRDPRHGGAADPAGVHRPAAQAARRRFDDLMAMTALFDGAPEFPTSLGAAPDPGRCSTARSTPWPVRYLCAALGPARHGAGGVTGAGSPARCRRLPPARRAAAGAARRADRRPGRGRVLGRLVADAAGRGYLDCGGYGVFLLGHRHPAVVAAVVDQLHRHPLATRLLLEPDRRPGRRDAAPRSRPEGLDVRPLRQLRRRGDRGRDQARPRARPAHAGRRRPAASTARPWAR